MVGIFVVDSFEFCSIYFLFLLFSLSAHFPSYINSIKFLRQVVCNSVKFCLAMYSLLKSPQEFRRA